MAAQLSDWLKGQIALYENLFGKINVPQGPPRSPTNELIELKKEEDITQSKEKQKRPAERRKSLKRRANQHQQTT